MYNRPEIMKNPISRRDAMRSVATAGAGALLVPAKALAQEKPLEIAGKPVEVTLTAVSPHTVRITIQPLENGQPKPVLRDGALVKEDFAQPAARVRVLGGARSVKCGGLTVKLTRDPFTIRVEGQGGRPIQQLQPDPATGKLTFQTGNAPVLGLGPGGPQFDKRGILDRMGSGQGGFRLATHGGKVPVQLAVGTSGWAMFIHQPLGAFDCALLNAEQTPSAANAAALMALGFPSACIDTHNAPTPYVAPNVGDTFGNVLGSACFPAVNTNTWTDSSGKLLSTCATVKDAGCALFGGEFTPDGKPDTYKDPKRVYQAVEIEFNKGFSHNWALIANWRIARLNGNYEGAFRNDNNQADPGISSLFDLTEGAFGLLGKQQGIGPLNTDRRHVVNIYPIYVLDHSLLKGMVLGGGLRIQTGLPLTTLAAQQAYQNAGEVHRAPQRRRAVDRHPARKIVHRNTLGRGSHRRLRGASGRH
jgi:hypothetical protein